MTSSSEARFISFEGLDGCGKTTQIKKLGAYLAQSRIPHALTHEPGGTALGGALRRILKDPRSVYRAFNGVFAGHPDFQTLNEDEQRFSASELLLFLAARAEFVAQVVQPHLEQDVSVLTDRCHDSTEAYQGGGLYNHNSSVLTFLNAAHEFVFHRARKPDLTFLLDIDHATMLARSSEAKLDFIEQRGEEYFKRVREAYLAIARREPSRVVVIDGTHSIDDIFSGHIVPRIRTLYRLG